jgi:DNA-directed RNA polymerase subunit L
MTDDNRPLSEKDLDYLATKADLLKLQKAVVKSLKPIKREVEDLWTRINEVDNAETELVDNAIDRVDRVQRALRRLEKRVEELEAQFEDEE